VLVCFTLPASGQQTAEGTETSANTATKEKNSALERYQIGEELIFTLQIDNLRYGELFGVVQQQGIMMSFAEFVTMLDFPIQRLDGDAYQYSGWFINQENSFNLLFYTSPRGDAIGELQIKGEKTLLSSSDVYDFAGEQLFDITTMGNWFGIAIDLDFRDLIIQGKPSTKLPIQLKFERENSRVFDNYNQSLKYPNYDFGYHWRSHQLLDANVFSQYSNNDLRTSYSVIGIQDFAKLSTRFYVSGSDKDAVQQAELNFQRQSPDGGLLGPLDASNISFGDILPTRTGGSSVNQSLGISINNNRLGVNYDSDVTSVRGLVQDNWDVELYQNGVLIRQANNISNGRYDFVDVPLFSGLNKFEVRKYGPQGQVEKELVERNVDGSLFSSTPSYNLSLTRTNSTLLGIGETDDLAQDWNLSGSYGLALTDWLSASFSHSIFVDNSDRVNSYDVSSSARLTSRLFSNFSIGYSENGATSFRANIQSKYFDQNLNLSLNRSIDANDSTSSRLSVLMNGNIFAKPWGSVGYTNDYRYSETDNDGSNTFFSNGLTFDNRYFTANHLFSYENQKFSDGTEADRKSGIVAIGSRIKRVNTRINANYDASDNFQWVSYGAGLTWQFASKYTTRLAYQKSVISNNESVSLGIDWREKTYAVNTQVRHDTASGLNVSLNARFSLSEAPVNPGYISTDSSLTTSGVVLVRLYEDKNFNFVFDEGDRPLEDVKVTASQFNISGRSNKDGIVQLKRLSSYQNTDLEVDFDTIDDPYLIQSTISTAITPRTGLLALVNYPFIQSTEVDGNASFVDQYGKERPLTYLKIELKNTQGTTVAETRSEFDGYFYINKIPPGKYTLEINEEALEAKELVVNDTIKLHLNKPGAFINGVKLSAQKKNSKTGFLSYIGEFSSSQTANTFMRIFNKRNQYNELSTKTFVTQDKTTERFFVGVALFSEDNKADNFCKAIKESVRYCKIRPHKLFL